MMGTVTGIFLFFLVVSEKFGTGKKVFEPVSVKIGIEKSLGTGIGNFLGIVTLCIVLTLSEQS